MIRLYKVCTYNRKSLKTQFGCIFFYFTGPCEHLTSLGIKCLRDLPVGDNLQDHIFTGGVNFLLKNPVSVVQSRVFNVDSMQAYRKHGTGPLTLLGGVEGIGFINTKYANPARDWPDFELHFASGSPVSDGGQTLRYAHGLRKDVWREVYANHSYEDSISIFPVMLRPKSVGMFPSEFSFFLLF